MTPRIMLVAQPTAGGTARHVAEIAAGCRARGLEVHVAEVAMAREIDPRRDLAAALRLRAAIAAAAPDVVHLHSAKAGALGRAAVRGLGRRPAVVYTPHAYAFLAQPGRLRRWCYRELERAMAPWTDCVVAVSDSEAHAAAQLGGGARIEVVPNGVGEVPAPTRADGPRRPRVGWLGRMTWQKRAEDAVTASFVLARLGVEHELVLGGDGPELPGVRAAIADLGAGTWMRAPGFVGDPRAFHAGIDLLLITSRAEGLPYAGLDAMAHGVPIVGYDAPGVRDLVEHGATGLLAPAGDPGALAAQLARLLRDRALRRDMGRAARARARTRFSLDDQLDRLCALYRALAARTQGGTDGRAA